MLDAIARSETSTTTKATKNDTKKTIALAARIHLERMHSRIMIHSVQFEYVREVEAEAAAVSCALVHNALTSELQRKKRKKK